MFYLEDLAPQTRMMSVSVEAGEAVFAFNSREVILDWPYLGISNEGRTYDVSLDGQRFLALTDGTDPDKAASSPQIIIVQNWVEELKRLMPTE